MAWSAQRLCLWGGRINEPLEGDAASYFDAMGATLEPTDWARHPRERPVRRSTTCSVARSMVLSQPSRGGDRNVRACPRGAKLVVLGSRADRVSATATRMLGQLATTAQPVRWMASAPARVRPVLAMAALTVPVLPRRFVYLVIPVPRLRQSGPCRSVQCRGPRLSWVHGSPDARFNRRAIAPPTADLLMYV